MRVSFHVMGRLLGFVSLFHHFIFIQETTIWHGSRVTTSPLRLLTADGFECCCTNVDASCINEISAVRAGSSVKVLCSIWFIIKQGKSRTFSKGPMYKSSFLFCVKLQQSHYYWKRISSLLPTSWKIVSLPLWPQLLPSISQVLNDQVLHHFHLCSVLPSMWWLQIFPNTCKIASYSRTRGMKQKKQCKQDMINLGN